ncbi:MAG: glycosyltransferase [Sedimenticola sp.]
MKKSVKIMYIGELSQHSRCMQRMRCLQDMGYEVKPVSTELTGKKKVLYKVLWKLRIPLDFLGVNKTILNSIDEYAVLLIEKGNTIYPSTLKRVRNSFPKVNIVSYSEDDMYAKHNRSIFYSLGLKYYHNVFTTKSYNVEELKNIGASKVIFVDKSYDEASHYPVEEEIINKYKLGSDVGFIGTFEINRAESILFLAQHGVKVRIWGTGWKSWIGKHKNIIIEDACLYGNKYRIGLCSTKINLCFLRKANRDLQTDRTMEIPACASFMLAERTLEHLRLFEEGKEAEYFDSNQELLDKIRYYLDHDNERKNIALKGRNRCINSGYSHRNRLNYMMRTIMSNK